MLSAPQSPRKAKRQPGDKVGPPISPTAQDGPEAGEKEVSQGGCAYRVLVKISVAPLVLPREVTETVMLGADSPEDAIKRASDFVRRQNPDMLEFLNAEAEAVALEPP